MDRYQADAYLAFLQGVPCSPSACQRIPTLAADLHDVIADPAMMRTLQLRARKVIRKIPAHQQVSMINLDYLMEFRNCGLLTAHEILRWIGGLVSGTAGPP